MSIPPPIRSLVEYERSMRRFELVGEGLTLPDINLVVRIDAHRLPHAWSDFPDEDYPLSAEFLSCLQRVAVELLKEGPQISLAFVAGDEISFLLNPKDAANERRRIRLATGIASQAAEAFLRFSGRGVSFHGVISELPTLSHVYDYFLWQWRVAERNFLTRILGILLSKDGTPLGEINRGLQNASLEEKHRLLETHHPAIDDIPDEAYQGALVWWERQPSDGGYEGAAQVDPDFLVRTCRRLRVADELMARAMWQLLSSPFCPAGGVDRQRADSRAVSLETVAEHYNFRKSEEAVAGRSRRPHRKGAAQQPKEGSADQGRFTLSRRRKLIPKKRR